ncbi:MAG TPA: nucleotidyltransferase domain-containing protein [Rhodospirillales bacterium]|nr:nucleotidyltransferase domain-containing protein [Rhodospirillales bacterium]
MGVFGAYVRGEQREDSDLDVLVDLGNGMTLIDLAGLQLELRPQGRSGDEGRA